MRLAPVLVAVLVGCNGGGDSDSDTDIASDAVCTQPTEVQCVDQMILDLALHDDLVATDADVTTTTEGSDFVTAVDASAGGFGQDANHPWVYVKFDSDGAHRVDIDDETALTSMDWDLAARRFILRLNGGSSGPSCVGAAAFLEKTYADLTAVPDGISYQTDGYYTDNCTIVNDSSGLPGSPQVAMAPWWSYDGCVATTGHPFLLQLADGRVIKLAVEQYYATGQATCNSSGTAGQDGGNFVFRWAFVQ